MAHHKILPAVQLLPQAAEALHAFAEKASEFLGAIVNPYKPSNALQNVNLACEISRLEITKPVVLRWLIYKVAKRRPD